ncbi:hypothetical protein KSX_42430 [Ktedonospora formicarum]|uniref:Uncharacterized protein n=2 Tax=Ktedonospora formicarum TaxID=2778364 RepID=A0A8J3I3A8_9CHLR|nr:hypothetical protein KSX_42430 [Ktedonospora formicarum]
MVFTRSMLNENGKQTIQALDAYSGVVRWHIPLLEQPCGYQQLCTSPLTYVADNRLIVLDDSQPSRLQVFDVASGKHVTAFPIALPASKGVASSLLNNGTLYLQTGIHEGGPYISGSSNTFWNYTIHAVHIADGTTAWQYQIGKLREYQDPISSMLSTTA